MIWWRYHRNERYLKKESKLSWIFEQKWKIFEKRIKTELNFRTEMKDIWKMPPNSRRSASIQGRTDRSKFGVDNWNHMEFKELNWIDPIEFTDLIWKNGFHRTVLTYWLETNVLKILIRFLNWKQTLNSALYWIENRMLLLEKTCKIFEEWLRMACIDF